MTKEIQAFIPSNDDTGDWFATILPRAASGKLFRLHAIRRIEPSESLRAVKTRSKSPFDRTVIPCFLDFASKGTLSRVNVLGAGIGPTGPEVVFETQRITAELQFILFGQGYEVESIPGYSAVDFRPSGLSQWLADSIGRPSADHFTQAQTVVESFDIADIGKFCLVLDHVGSLGKGEENRKFSPRLTIEFASPRSFAQVDGICSLLDSLFSFLTMTAVKPSSLLLSPVGPDERLLHRHKLLRSGNLWRMKSRDRTFSNFLSSRSVGSIAHIANGVLNSWGDSGLILHALLKSLHFSDNCEDCFVLVFPHIERYLDQWFGGKEEVNFRSQETSFFDYVRRSEDASIIEFSKKHLKVVDSKKRGLQQKLECAITGINEIAGSSIPSSFGRTIHDFRKTRFHGSGFQSTVRAMSDCVEIAHICNFMLTVFLLETMKIDRAAYRDPLRSLFPVLYA